MDTPKTEEKTTTVNAEGNKSEAPKKKKNIIRVFHAQNASDGGKGRRKPAAGEKKGPARSQNGGQRPAGQEQTQETVSPVSRETVRVARIVLRAEDRRVIVRKEEETATVTEEASREEETVETVLVETVPRMVRDVRQDRVKETEDHVRMTEEAETVSAVEQTVARAVRADASKAEMAETVSAAEQTVARAARVDVLKAEVTVSAVRTAAARAEHVRDREEAVLPIPYSLRS